MGKAATSGQFRDLIGKLLTKINDQMVATIDGKKIQDAIDSADPTAENFIDWINNGCKVIVKSVKHFFLLEVVSDGRNGEQFIASLKEKGFRIGDYAMQVLRKKDFIPTKGTKYKPVVIFGKEIEEDSERTTENIRKIAKDRGYITPPAELAPLLREKISDKEIEEMGVWALIVMHEPIKDSGGNPKLLLLDRRDDGQWLDTCNDYPGRRWDREDGFVFLAPQD